MKKLFTIFIAIAVLSGLSFAQGATSDIYGTVVLPDGSAIPGVAVTLTGEVVGKKVTVTSENGNFRFLKLAPGIYSLQFELEGFKTVLQKGIRLFVGKNKTFNVQMETTKLKEVVEVKGQAGVVDTRKTTVSVSVSKEMIQSLPTARNPWTVLNLVPGMMVDREDVGGNESGQQSSFYGNGASDDDTTWNVDGANITDPSAIGAAPGYLNINSYEELQVTLGSNDITAQTGGTQLNFVSKRGGNLYSGDFHLYVEDEKWQMNQTLPQEMIDAGLSSPGIQRLYQYGVNFGGPIIKDKIWFFGSYAIQDIHSVTVAQTEDATWLVGAYAKLNFQFDNTSADLHYSSDTKYKWGRTAIGAANQDPGSTWDQIGPGSVYSGSLQHIMGNLMLNAKFAYTDGGFTLDPKAGDVNPNTGHFEGSDWAYYDYPSMYWGGNTYYYTTNRNSLNVTLSGNYFAEGVMGGDHEIRFGVDYYTAQTTSQTLYPNQRILYSYNKLAPDLYKEIWWVADGIFDVGFERTSFYLSDTATFGKLTANMGIRYDKETGSHNEAVAPGLTFNGAPIFASYLGDLTAPQNDIASGFEVISPRFSITYDLNGDGKNVVKLSLARYGSQSGNSIAAHTWTVGPREIDVFWNDNGNGIAELGEWSEDPNDWLWWNINEQDPYSIASRNKYASDLNSPLLDEVILSFEKALGDDMAVSLTGLYKKRHNLLWRRGNMPDGSLETAANWYVEGIHTFTDGQTKEYYNRYTRPRGTTMTNHGSDYYDLYMGVQLAFTKKFSNKWMFDTSFSYADWKQKRTASEYFGGTDSANPTNYGYFNEGVVAPESGGSGVQGIYVNSRWQFKLSGLYQLPWGINFTGVFQAREGYVIPYHERRYVSGFGWTSVYEPGKKFGDDRLPTFWMLSLGLEKTVKVSETVSTTLFVDGYNITNNAVSLKVNPVMGASQDLIQRVLNPGIFQFGIRVNF